MDVHVLSFIHHSREPLVEVRASPQDGSDSRRAKPNGLWFSVVDRSGNDDWLRISRENSFGRTSYATEVIFKPSANIVWLGNEEDIKRFDAKYGYYITVPKYDIEGDCCGEREKRRVIEWKCVAEKYAAIIVAPYYVGLHMREHWYFEWDCASGCVWTSDAVKLRRKRDF